MSNKAIFITGASSDIGAALIRKLLKEDAEAIILANYFSGAERIAELTAEFGDKRVVPLRADLSIQQELERLAQEVLDHGPPRAFVHLPALRLSYDRFTKLKWDHFMKDFAIQVQSAACLLQRLLPKMSKTPNARVLFVLSSVTLGMPPKYMSGYTVAKYAQLGLMKALAAEYAGTSVCVNAISPSMVDTQFVEEVAEVAREMSAAANPLGRNATTDDLLDAMMLLLSPGSGYINGINLPITAGLIA